MQSKPEKSKKRVLSNHKKVGKRYIPPFVYRLSDRGIALQPTKWLDNILPEILWIGLLNERYGIEDGTELALTFAQTYLTVLNSDEKKMFISTATYSELSPVHRNGIVKELKASKNLIRMKRALDFLITLYPKCPLHFLYDQEQPELKNFEDNLHEFQEIVAGFIDRRSKPAMLMQSTAVYIGLVTKVLNIQSDNNLTNLQAMTDYPNTDESRRFASNVRATVSSFFMHDYPEDGSSWAKYFWSQGIKMVPCDLKQIWENYEKQ